MRGNDTDSTALGSGTDKKSSFATSEWLAQCKAANNSTDVCPATSEQKEVSSSQNENNLKAASKQHTESHGQERCRTSPVDRRNSSTNVVKQLESQRHRSRSPVNSTRPAAQAGNSRSYQSRSPSSQMEQLRRNEVQLGQLWNQRPPASMLSSPESARIGAKLMYASEVKSGAHRGMYDRELPSPIASSNNASRSVNPSPIKSALRQPTTPSAPVEAYLTRYAQEVPDTTATSSRYQQFDRSIDYALSQMKNASK